MGGQACAKIPTLEDLGFWTQTMMTYMDHYGKILMGNAGEEAADEYAVTYMNYSLANFNRQRTGFDNMFRDGSGKLVIGESKATKASGLNALSNTKHGKEGSVEWIEYNAKLLCDPLSSYSTEANRKIGEEILSIGAKNIEFVVIHLDMNKFGTDTTDYKSVVDVTRLR